MAYVSTQTFAGHQDSVNTLAFSPDNQFLASGGDDCVLFILRPDTGREIHKLRGPCPVTALTWASTVTEKSRLFVGYANGKVLVATVDHERICGHYLPREKGGHVEDLCLVNLAASWLLAICTGPDVEVWRESTSTTSKQVTWSHQRLNAPPTLAAGQAIMPRSAHFTNQATQIVVAYMNHGLLCWDLRTSELLWNMSLRCARIGKSAISADGRLMAVSNLYDGFDLYNLEDQALVRTYRTQITENIPLPVAIAEDAFNVDLLTGSSLSEIHIYHVIPEADDVQILCHKDKLVQALAYSSLDDGSRLIAAGSSESGVSTIVKIWKRLPPTRVPLTGTPDEQALPTSDIDVSLPSPDEEIFHKADCFDQSGAVASESEAGPRRYSPQLVLRQLTRDIRSGILLVMNGVQWFRGWPTKYPATVLCLLAMGLLMASSQSKPDNVVASGSRSFASIVAGQAVNASVSLVQYIVGILTRYVSYAGEGGLVDGTTATVQGDGRSPNERAGAFLLVGEEL